MRRALEGLRRLWPRRLAGQMIALLLLALVLAQAASFLIFVDERWAALRTAERKHILSRTASIVRLIESTPVALHEQIVRTASSRLLEPDEGREHALELRHGGDITLANRQDGGLRAIIHLPRADPA